MPVDTGPYCSYCVDHNGALQTFDKRLRRMTDFMVAQNPGRDRTTAELDARAYMRTMPAWRDHPGLAE